MPEPNSDPIPEAMAASLIPTAVGTGSDALGVGASGAVPVPDRIGEYVVLGQLGRGGMGVVYRAEDPHLKREVALKVLLPQFADNPLAKARFVREARAQAKVEHDHVVSIFRVAEHSGLPYLVMPLLKGMTLHAALKANSRPPLSEVIRIGREVAEGLAAAHRHGLVHRDIKPANIWLEGKKLRVKVLDFGLARLADVGADSSSGPVTRQGAIIGTPAYMSPEQGRGLPVDGRTDLWSLGVILYQMTTGALPFRGATMLAMLTSLGLDTPVPPVAVNPTVPVALSDFVMRLLAKDPAYRPPTAEIVAAELRAIPAGPVNAVGVIPLDAPPPIIVPAGPDPFADLDATETGAGEATPQAASNPGRAGVSTSRVPIRVYVVGVLLTVALIVGIVVSQMGKKSTGVVQEEPPAPVAPPKPDPPKNVYLSDLSEEAGSVGHGQFGKRGQLGYQNGQISVKGVPSPHGLSMHPPRDGTAYVRYDTKARFQLLTGSVAVNDTGVGKLPIGPTFVVLFAVKGDGKELWNSRPLRIAGEAEPFSINVARVRRLELEVRCPGTNSYAHAVWIEPMLQR